jgi:mRNA interferase MazF
VLLISRDRAYATRSSVTIAPITTRIRGIRTEVEVGPVDGLARPSVVNLDDITTVRKQMLVGRITDLSPAKMAEVERAIKFALALK